MAKKKRKEPKDELQLEKQALDPLVDDLPVEEAEAADVQGGRAPPYVPVGPVVSGSGDSAAGKP